ncbi:MAG: hypothetical protein WC552_00825 [Candidatus Omnitrophota bacterium]
MKKTRYGRVGQFICLGILLAILAGCSTAKGNVGRMATYAVSPCEADWIRNGEPIEFEGEKWYPQDSMEILLDAEVYLLGEYHGVQFFIEKVDVRPYSRLYTKFGRTKFRIFEKRTEL